MEASDYLLDTSVLSCLLLPDRKDKDGLVRSWESGLPVESHRLISVVAVGEVEFGLKLARIVERKKIIPELESFLHRVKRDYVSLGITASTIDAYSSIKSNLAENVMPKRIRNMPNAIYGNPELWRDEVKGKDLQIQENDLWQCAQALERNLTFATCDGGIHEALTSTCGTLGLRIQHVGR